MRRLEHHELAMASIVLLLAFVAVQLAYTVTVARASSDTDLLAFTCAGHVYDDGGDPYRAAPLFACERSIEAALEDDPSRRLPTVDPVPYPPAIFVPLGLFARLPFHAGAVAFAFAQLAAFLVTVRAVGRFVSLPWWGIAIIFLPADFLSSARLGQLPTFAIAGATLAAAALARGRPRAAGAWALLTLVQPNLALPILVSLALRVPRARLPVVAGAALFLAACLAARGPALALEYATRVLPAQAAAEASFAYQFSLTWLAWLLGAPENLAVRIGAVQQLLAAAAAIAFAPRVARALGSDAALVALPALAAVTFGSYVHEAQLAFALPFGLLVATAPIAPRLRFAAWLAVLALDLPTFEPLGLIGVPLLAALALAVETTFATQTLANRIGIGVGSAFALGAAFSILSGLPRVPLRAPATVAAYLTTGADPGEASGLRGLDERRLGLQQEASLRVLGEKLLPWGALLTLGGLAVAVSRRARSVGAR